MRQLQFGMWRLMVTCTIFALLTALFVNLVFRQQSRLGAYRLTEERLMQTYRRINSCLDNGEKITSLHDKLELPNDGYGTRLLLVEREGVYWIVSNGADKLHGTEDDKSVLIPVASKNR